MGWNVDVVFKKSTLHGTGVFARQPIAKGTKVWAFDDSMHVCDLADLAALSREDLHYALHGGFLHHPTQKFVWYRDGQEFVNHAAAPNANIGITEWTALEEDNCTALRDIEVGEELTEDYRFWSVHGLAKDHWLYKLYADFCPGHLEFLMSLEKDARAA